MTEQIKPQEIETQNQNKINIDNSQRQKQQQNEEKNKNVNNKSGGNKKESSSLLKSLEEAFNGNLGEAIKNGLPALIDNVFKIIGGTINFGDWIRKYRKVKRNSLKENSKNASEEKNINETETKKPISPLSKETTSGQTKPMTTDSSFTNTQDSSITRTYPSNSSSKPPEQSSAVVSISSSVEKANINSENKRTLDSSSINSSSSDQSTQGLVSSFKQVSSTALGTPNTSDLDVSSGPPNNIKTQIVLKGVDSPSKGTTANQIKPPPATTAASSPANSAQTIVPLRTNLTLSTPKTPSGFRSSKKIAKQRRV